MNEQQMKAMVDSIVDQVTKSVPTLVEDQIKGVTETVAQINEAISKGQFASETPKDAVIKNAGQFFKALTKAGAIEKVDSNVKAAFLNETADAEGGYLVPNEFAKEVLYVASQYGVARKYCHIIPMSTDKKDISKIVSGVTVYWTAEGSAYTASKPTIGQIQLIANKATALVDSTHELIDDNMTDEEVFTVITRLVGEAFAAFEDNQVFNGVGTGLNFMGLTVDTGVTGITVGAPTYDKIVELMVAVPSKYLAGRKPKFFMKRKTWGDVMKLKDLEGRPIFQMIPGSPLGELLGVEIVEVPSLADGTIIFGDLYHYAIGDRKTVSIEAGYYGANWASDIKSLKACERIAGKVKFADAFSILEAA